MNKLKTLKIGAIEAGGTKFVCGIGDQAGNILDKITIPTTTPKDTLSAVFDYFENKDIAALGVGSFGPIDPILHSKTYGFITKTPKVGWVDFDLLGTLRAKLKIPMSIDTDVNAAALAEYTWGFSNDLNSAPHNLVYLTIGTGVGGGAVINGKPLQGLLHPEMGHMSVKRAKNDAFGGNCPYHQDCLEGLISGPAIFKRTGIKAQDLACTHPSWDLTAYYLAQGITNIILVLSPEKIILGGGVMQQSHLFPLIHKHVKLLLNGYIAHQALQDDIANYIIPPKLGTSSGLKGSLALGIIALKS